MHRFLTSALALIGTISAMAGTAQAAPDSYLLERFSDFDRNADGIVEIKRLEALPFEESQPPNPRDAHLVVVFVESRLLESDKGPEAELVDRLARLKSDLRADGYHSLFVEADVYAEEKHQDGRTLLAMRDFLKDVRGRYPRMAGTILIGSFPEATIVNRFPWIKKTNKKGDVLKKQIRSSHFLHMYPHLLDSRADIVLGDLDGRWDQIYYPDSEDIAWLTAEPHKALGEDWWPVEPSIFISTNFLTGTVSYEDFFFIQDDITYDFHDSDRRVDFKREGGVRNPEIADSDASLPNPIARPDVIVSRINPRNIALNPDHPDALDANGHPRSVEMAQGENMGWKRDGLLERRVLVDYLDRNHDFRTGRYADLPFRAGAATYPNSDFSVSLKEAEMDAFRDDFDAPLSAPKDPSLIDYVDWLKQPVTLRFVMAHSNMDGSYFGAVGDVFQLAQAAGGVPYDWPHLEDGSRIPRFGGRALAASSLYRTLWEYGVLDAAGPSFLIHAGCEVNATDASLSFNHEDYARSSQDHLEGLTQTAEAQLFYTNLLAMIARAKEFYDDPLDVGSGAFEWGDSVAFGHVWSRYFTLEMMNAEVADVYQDRKRAYNWSVLGDWSLQLRYEPGLGVMSADGSKMKSVSVHADQSSIDDWDFDSQTDAIEFAGDFDGNGVDELIVTSDSGLALVEQDGDRWSAPIVKERGSRFGGWWYNPDNDEIVGVGDFDRDNRDEILIRSAWGLGILERVGDDLTSLVMVPDRTHTGSWYYEDSNQIVGIADMNGDGRDDIVVTSPWGIGVLSVSGSDLSSTLVQPRGTLFGGWWYNSDNDTIQAIANFDGMGGDDLLITSAWGLGILRQSGDTLTSAYMAESGTWFGGWRYNPANDTIRGTADFDGDGGDEIFISSAWGIGVLELQSGRLVSRLVAENGTNLGGWRVDSSRDRILAVADLNRTLPFTFNDNRGDEVILTDGYRIGMLRDFSGRSSTTNQIYDVVYPDFKVSDIRTPGDRIGDWPFEGRHQVTVVGDFDELEPGLELLMQR